MPLIKASDWLSAISKIPILFKSSLALSSAIACALLASSLASKLNKAKLPTHVELNCDKYDLAKDSVVLLEQLRTIDKKRLKDKVCHLDNQILLKIDKALEISLELYT